MAKPRRLIPVKAACSILRVTAGQYYDWRKLGMFGSVSPRAQLHELDAVEIGTLKVLTDSLGPASARMAYRQVRGDLIVTVPPTAFEIVWIQQDRVAVLVRTDADLVTAVRASGAVTVVSPRAEIERAVKAWNIEYEDRLHNLAVLKRGRRHAHEGVS